MSERCYVVMSERYYKLASCKYRISTWLFDFSNLNMEYKISNHCLEQINQRGISKDDIHRVLNNPDMILKQDEEIFIYQPLSLDKQFV